MVRAVMEGVAFGLRRALDVLRSLVALESPLVLVGGGAKAPLWRRIYANVYGVDVVRSGIGQQAASLGAAIVAGIGTGVWKDFGVVEDFSKSCERIAPQREEKEEYEKLYKRYCSLAAHLGDWAKEFE
jgi:sugar (pentulose or hexulose) kinase